MELATFGAGCFWGIELRFSELDGVVATDVGYMGGHLDEPSYQQVCTDSTGHAEVVQITFDPTKVNYEQLLNCFWQWHDPTTLNRQGPDVGSQYRSAIFYHSDAQKLLAQQSMEEITQLALFANPLVTTLEPAATFWRAEEYHQDYLKKRGMSSCHI
ncbi:peptide-methionine (S)-S-oxide reductase MsrA [Marinobacterium sp. LSUCC0821]|jgi:peptide-methionine (S)-S-oxide reductase|uniref:peptide-methionine (S)-S-oxide reductase MsrA n=1 Tax=Marinobacterium sp. LSUCC0821 TaxID=2668067 RepID=UPI0014523583|nr:peptide-methionine (S)-S-oxide reductase MsrA [Marinobacterium sp. LSUCC0821]QJD71412.1 peptide-methionine (S)-S-oxide reductase MsrA [Marinobacterium sp. LSUCC0821]